MVEYNENIKRVLAMDTPEMSMTPARVAAFGVVSYEEFRAATRKAISDGELYDMEEHEIDLAYQSIKMPARATRQSAGYDIFSPFSFRLKPQQSITIPTGINYVTAPGWTMLIIPKSGKGTKYRMQLRNTIPLIDADYFFSQNEGDILLKITNDSYEGREMEIQAGDSIVQALFTVYGITVDDNADGVRDGGFGSTVK